MRRNLKVTVYSKTCLECLKKEYECILNDKVPSRLLITRGKVTYPFCFVFSFCFGKAALGVLLVSVPLHIFLMWVAVFITRLKLSLMVQALHVEKMDN